MQYSVSSDIPVQNIQAVRIFQYRRVEAALITRGALLKVQEATFRTRPVPLEMGKE